MWDFFSPPYVIPQDQTRVIRLGGKCLFTGPSPPTFSLLLLSASLLSLLISPPHPTPNFCKLLEFRSWMSRKGPFVKDLGAHPLCYWSWYNLWVWGSSGRKPRHWGSALGGIFRLSAPPCLHLSLLPGWVKWAALFQHSGPLLTHRVTEQQVTNDGRRQNELHPLN